MRRSTLNIFTLFVSVTMSISSAFGATLQGSKASTIADKCLTSLNYLAVKHSGVTAEQKAEALAFLSSTEVADALATAAIDSERLPTETLYRLSLCGDLATAGQMMQPTAG
jgi:hypothetical protein